MCSLTYRNWVNSYAQNPMFVCIDIWTFEYIPSRRQFVQSHIAVRSRWLNLVKILPGRSKIISFVKYSIFQQWEWPHILIFALGLYSLSGKSLTARSREVSKPRDSSLDFSNRSEIWRCRDACQISEDYDHYKIQSRSFETSRDLAVRRLTA